MIFNRDDCLAWGVSEKRDGSMRLGGESEGENLENRARYFGARGIELNRVVSAGLRHGSQVVSVSALDQAAAGADGLVTAEKNLVLSVTIADCLAIFFFDPVREVIGLAHAGWKGIAAGIVEGMMDKLRLEFDSNRDDLLVYLSPHIQACHFEVQADVASQFSSYKKAIVNQNGQTFIDLSLIVESKLVQAGIKRQQIEISQDCTYCQIDKYFSYRRDKPAEVQAMAAYIGLL